MTSSICDLTSEVGVLMLEIGDVTLFPNERSRLVSDVVRFACDVM